MPTVTAALSNWALLLATHAGLAPRRPAQEPTDDGLIYRLRQWPTLPSAIRTAEVFRLLSVMSHRAVNRRWMLAHSRLEPAQIEALLERLVARGDVEVIDVRQPKAA